MTKNEFLQLFELNEIYEQYKKRKSFGFGLFDNLTGSETFVIFNFNENNLKINIDCFEFSETKQQLEIHLIIQDTLIEINEEEVFKNELFTFLTFDTNLDSSLKFLANFINKILKPKYQLIGGISIH